VGFHAQQAVEKALKAVLASREVEFPFIHNLGYLAELCEKHAIELPETLAGMEQLTPFAAMLRYGSPEQKVDRKTALSWAASAVEWARSVIEPIEPKARADDSRSDTPGPR
jgi:HEPN domain-containing protein